MNFLSVRIACRVGFALAFASAGNVQAQGQRASPHLGFVYPAGGQQGATFTVSIGGQNLNGATAAYFSGSGIQARVVGYERPLTQKELNDLREQAQQLQEKRTAARADPTKPAFTPDDEKRAGEIRQTIATRGNRQAAPTLAETVTLEITLAADAPPGERELRLKTPPGLSNPIMFCVGQLPEVSTPAVTSTSLRAPPQRDRAQGPAGGRSRVETEIPLPALVNGQILPGEVDRFRFTARKGQRLVFAVSARALLPYLADAVPGWFQATLGVYDAHGRELVYDDDFRFNPDPVLSCEIPADGVYGLEIKDAIYRGREDFVYRIAVGELPFVTSIFPLGAAIGGRTTIDLAGWNLPAATLSMDTQDKSPGTFLLAVRQKELFSNFVRVALDSRPECLAIETSDRLVDAQPLTLPAIVNGRIDRPGDEDAFRFEGKAGDEIIADVLARRLGSPLDSILTLVDAAGRSLATNDDTDDKGSGLLTHHADSRIQFTLPASGLYTLRLADTQRRGGPDYGYRLRVGAPQPDFELRVVPSTINVRSGTSVPIAVYALRRDGFAGEIALGMKDAPKGYALSGARIPAGQDMVWLTLTAATTLRDEVRTLVLGGRATIDGRLVARVAVPAEDMMQAFAYRHLVPARELKVCVAGRGAGFRVVDPARVMLSANGTARIRVTTPAARSFRNLTFELGDSAGCLVVRSVSCRGEVADIVVSCDPAKVKPGMSGNLILHAYGDAANAAGKRPNARAPRISLGTVPAIPFEIESSGNPGA